MLQLSAGDGSSKPALPCTALPQWVFYLFGASAVAWLPIWLPLRLAQPPPGGTTRGGGSLGLKRVELSEAGSMQPLPSGLETIEEIQVGWEGPGAAAQDLCC